MALVDSSMTLKWSSNRLMEKLNFRLNWSLFNSILPSTIILNWECFSSETRSFTFKWSLDSGHAEHIFSGCGRQQIYLFPVVNRIYKIDNDIINKDCVRNSLIETGTTNRLLETGGAHLLVET